MLFLSLTKYVLLPLISALFIFLQVSGFHVVHRTQSDKPSTLKINRVFMSELAVFEPCKSDSLFSLRVLFDIF